MRPGTVLRLLPSSLLPRVPAESRGAAAWGKAAHPSPGARGSPSPGPAPSQRPPRAPPAATHRPSRGRRAPGGSAAGKGRRGHAREWRPGAGERGVVGSRSPAKGGGERGLTAGAFLPLPSAAGQGPGASLLGGREEEAQEEAAGAEPQLLLHGRQVPR